MHDDWVFRQQRFLKKERRRDTLFYVGHGLFIVVVLGWSFYELLMVVC